MIIRNSAKAILIRDEKLLAIRFRDEDGIYYLLPGGGQEPGEMLTETVKRELIEEAGIEVEVGDMVLVRECFHQKGVHRVEFMFACTYKSETASIVNPDDKQEGVDWLPLAELRELPLYPESLRDAILEYHKGKLNRVYAGEMA